MTEQLVLQIIGTVVTVVAAGFGIVRYLIGRIDRESEARQKVEAALWAELNSVKDGSVRRDELAPQMQRIERVIEALTAEIRSAVRDINQQLIKMARGGGE